MHSCPRCRHSRQAHETAPDWQCPACGVAYAKAYAMQAATSSRAAPRIGYAAAAPSLAWSKWLLIAVIIFGAWQGGRVVTQYNAGTSSMSEKELRDLATTVTPTDVLIYPTTDCPYCAQAKRWMTQYGFAFTECDAQVREECARDLERLGNGGVPYLIVREHHMKDGFDSDEFIAALR